MAALTLCLASVALADELQTVGDSDSLGFSARRLERITSWFEAQRTDQKLRNEPFGKTNRDWTDGFREHSGLRWMHYTTGCNGVAAHPRRSGRS